MASDRPLKKARITPECPTPEEKKKTWLALTIDHVHHFTLWWNPEMTWAEAMAAFEDCYAQVAERLDGNAAVYIMKKTESRLGQQNQVRAIEPDLSHEAFSLLDSLKQEYDGGNHPGPLRLHMTLFEGDDPDNWLGKEIKVTHMGIHWGKVDFQRCLTHPDTGRLPILPLPAAEQALWNKVHAE